MDKLVIAMYRLRPIQKVINSFSTLTFVKNSLCSVQYHESRPTDIDRLITRAVQGRKLDEDEIKKNI